MVSLPYVCTHVTIEGSGLMMASLQYAYALKLLSNRFNKWRIITCMIQSMIGLGTVLLAYNEPRTVEQIFSCMCVQELQEFRWFLSCLFTLLFSFRSRDSRTCYLNAHLPSFALFIFTLSTAHFCDQPVRTSLHRQFISSTSLCYQNVMATTTNNNENIDFTTNDRSVLYC